MNRNVTYCNTSSFDWLVNSNPLWPVNCRLILCRLSLYSSLQPRPSATIITLFLPKKNLPVYLQYIKNLKRMVPVNILLISWTTWDYESDFASSRYFDSSYYGKRDLTVAFTIIRLETSFTHSKSTSESDIANKCTIFFETVNIQWRQTSQKKFAFAFALGERILRI